MLVLSLVIEFVDGLVVVVILVKLSLDEYIDELVRLLALIANEFKLLLPLPNVLEKLVYPMRRLLFSLLPLPLLLRQLSKFNEVESILGAFECVLDVFEFERLLLKYIYLMTRFYL